MKFFALYLFNIHEVVQDKSTESCLKSFLDFISNSFDVQYFIKAFWFVFMQVLFRDKYSDRSHMLWVQPKKGLITGLNGETGSGGGDA